MSENITWSADDGGQYVVLSMELQSQEKYTEVADYAHDAVDYYAFKKVRGPHLSRYKQTTDRLTIIAT